MIIIFVLTLYFTIKSHNFIFILFFIPNIFLLFYSFIALRFFLTTDYLDYKINPSLFYDYMDSNENITKQIWNKYYFLNQFSKSYYYNCGDSKLYIYSNEYGLRIHFNKRDKYYIQKLIHNFENNLSPLSLRLEGAIKEEGRSGERAE